MYIRKDRVSIFSQGMKNKAFYAFNVDTICVYLKDVHYITEKQSSSLNWFLEMNL